MLVVRLGGASVEQTPICAISKPRLRRLMYKCRYPEHLQKMVGGKHYSRKT
jgi:hypothetical protein